jgi:hypothetical protein
MPLRRFLLLLSAVLALVPASGAALCVEQSGHLTVKLACIDCVSPAAASDAGLDACRDCEDTPLSVGAAQRTALHLGFDAALLPAATPAGLALESNATPTGAAPRFRPLSQSRTPLLRC